MRGRGYLGSAAGAAALLLIAAAPLSAEPPGFPPPCDQYNPFGPAGHVRITLDSSNFTHREGDEMRSFIETGSIGKVDAVVVGSAPPGAVVAMSALPVVSRYSPDYGEELKGIDVRVALGASRRPARVTIDLRQVCARHFRDTFLYY